VWLLFYGVKRIPFIEHTDYAIMVTISKRSYTNPKMFLSKSPHPNLLGNCSCVTVLTYIHVGIPLEKE
jgi:hypothetical protein